MSQPIPRKNPNRGHQSQQSYSRSPHSHTHMYTTHSHTQHPHSHSHSRNRSQQLRAEAAELQQFHQHQHYTGTGTGAGITSDYESDTARYMASHPPPPPAALAARTNTELNLSVLRRYRPGITSILSIAANAVVYVFTPPSKWDKSNMEGTMFICAQTPNPNSDEDSDPENAASDGCLFVLNRKGLINLIIDLSDVSDFELATGLLIFKMDGAGVTVPMENEESVRSKVLSLWVYSEDENDRRTNAALVHELWSKARAAREEVDVDVEDTEDASGDVSTSTSPGDDDEVALPMAQAGRQLSLSELFGRNMNGIGGIGGA
ncbi:PH domain-like protein [Hypoxylon trugodes]|uniref:PH domain-like protein n=1 Tax=Hypoxylon trugodes TaxID=326681 RepID=UPI00219C41D5|nr:PH domain-like protein [Hypoxylon trugodes]KAI1390692.1 PH domain-like protein [Hypoxylon trugodes]